MKELVKRVLKGETRAASRLMRLLEDGGEEGIKALKELYHYTGSAYIIGITGNSGAGKSTLIDSLIREYRLRGLRVGVVAVDPSSPFTHGAILGDRLRMQSHSLDSGVFIRSLATRGRLGGLSASTDKMVQVLDAMGFDILLIETVGVGQDEVEVAELAFTTVVVMAPGLGDDVQMIKAGILEIADIFVVNKADRENADKLAIDLETQKGFAPAKRGWDIPVLKTVSTTGEGIPTLYEMIESHRRYLKENGLLEEMKKSRISAALLKLVEETLREEIKIKVISSSFFRELLDAVTEKRIDPYTASERIFRQLKDSAVS